MYKNKEINKILDAAISSGASDIHLTSNICPILRVDGILQEMKDFPINDRELLRLYVREIVTEEEIKKYERDKCLDTSFRYRDSRFRVHIFCQMNGDAIALRLIPTHIPKFGEIGLPIVLQNFTSLDNGLVLIVGATGSGKSTTLATIINDINNNYKKHIITVESPIEFIHEHKMSMINQREVGVDVNNFSDAVKSAMREDPDILLVGEMRDLDTISNAITMAETGHLVFGTLHTRSVADTIDRIIDVFPPNQQEQIRIQLSSSIQGIVSQELLPKIGGGRVPCCEIMFVTDAIRNQIKEHASPNSIRDSMMAGSKRHNSQTKETALANLVINGLIDVEVAYDRINDNDRDGFNKLLTLLRKKEC